MTDQFIEYTNKSYGLRTDLKLEVEDGGVNHSSLMHHIHEIEKLVGYCGTFSLTMVSEYPEVNCE